MSKMQRYKKHGKRIVVCSGGFDPLHSGHIAYFKAAKQLGDILVVAVNSDDWLVRKKGHPFMSLTERINIVRELSVVDQVITFDDSCGHAGDAIEQVLAHANTNDLVVFANGGDRTNVNTPEQNKYQHNKRVEFVWAVGGEDKKNSSSWILDQWKTSKIQNDWGWCRILSTSSDYSIKEMVIESGKTLPDRNTQTGTEYWHVLKGTCTIVTETGGIKKIHILKEAGPEFTLNQSLCHQAFNRSDEQCHILLVQYHNQSVNVV